MFSFDFCSGSRSTNRACLYFSCNSFTSCSIISGNTLGFQFCSNPRSPQSTFHLNLCGNSRTSQSSFSSYPGSFNLCSNSRTPNSIFSCDFGLDSRSSQCSVSRKSLGFNFNSSPGPPCILCSNLCGQPWPSENSFSSNPRCCKFSS
jgi:hypothetical protein